jgi:hypothetical protein
MNGPLYPPGRGPRPELAAAGAMSVLFPDEASPLQRARTADLVVEVGVDTTFQYFQKRGSNGTNATNYATALFAAVSALYERDVQTRLALTHIRIFTTSADPYNEGSDDSLTYLDRLRTLVEGNTMPQSLREADLVHLLHTSPNGLLGGIAYLDTLCFRPFNTGFSDLDGFYNYPTSSYTWDVNVVAHELGHNFASPHTHCYSPPIDQCFNEEPGCYSGNVVASTGTIMSYCHLLAFPGVTLNFHPRVIPVLRGGATIAPCVSPISTPTPTPTPSPSPTPINPGEILNMVIGTMGGSLVYDLNVDGLVDSADHRRAVSN